MPVTIEVIEAKKYYNKERNLSASIYGAKPLGDDWKIVNTGYTWRMIDSNGSITIGLGRKPVATRAEAEEIAEAVRKLHTRK